MGYCGGGDLSRHLKQVKEAGARALPEDEVVDKLIQVCDALMGLASILV